MEALDQRQRWDARVNQMAREVIDEARVQLMLKFRFLDLALWRMEAIPFPVRNGRPLATDGAAIYFDGEGILARFQESFDEVIRDYLQVVMHCLFRHPFDTAHDRSDAWWLACDVMAESAALELCGGRFPSELDPARKAALAELRFACGALTPARLYGLFVRAFTAPQGTVYQGLGPGRLNELAALFARDNHEAWPAWAQGAPEDEPGEVNELGRPGDDGEEGDEASQELQATGDEAPDATSLDEQAFSDAAAGRDEGEDAQGVDQAADQAADQPQAKADEGADGNGSSAGEESEDTEELQAKSQDERDWEEIAKQVEVDLETFSKEWGQEAGSFVKLLRSANRPRHDYSEFLRRFALLSEEMKVNDDEYDYIFYTYGLALYGNMPLIEPLEYKETQRIRDFVIALDTSESCSDDLVRRFLSHTFSLLKAQEDFAHSVNIHLIQCDARVQGDTKITDLRDIDSFMEGFHVRGRGGTDFRPVFGYVEDLRAQGDLTDLKGLLYFTDGLGTYPEAAPDFDAAFVFVDNGQATAPSVPPWAMKVVLDEEGISRLTVRGIEQ